MINQKYKDMLNQKDIIFETFYEYQRRVAIYGEENVFNFSLGNPSVEPPDSVYISLNDKINNLNPIKLHSYSPAKGIPEARYSIAKKLNDVYNTHYEADNIFMTIGAAGALAHAFRAVAEPGDEIIAIAPCFSEYKPYTEGAGLSLKIVPPDVESFQIRFDILEEMITEKVSAVLINSPSNPSGTVYTEQTLKRLSDLLTAKSEEYGHVIFLISDEPYRDIIFNGYSVPYPALIYKNTLTCYSFSKSISLPGERIGYVAINPECEYAELLIDIFPQISRTIGQNGPASLMQYVVADVCGDTSDLQVYETNKNILYSALTEFGYSCVEPQGTFYMFPKAPGGDAFDFCSRATEKNLMIVPGDIFYCPGHFRISYCVPTEQVKRSLHVFHELAVEYGLCK